MSQTRRVSGRATRTIKEGDRIEVFYHSTAVVTVTPKEIRLDHGGWLTTTTKLRMNQAANQYGLGYIVFQKKGSWFVQVGDKTIPYDKNPMVLHRNGDTATRHRYKKR